MRAGHLSRRRGAVRVYPRPLRLLHWLIAGLIASQIGLAAVNAAVYEPYPVLAEAAVQAHLSLGVLIAVLVVARLGVRVGLGVPPPPDGMARPARWAAGGVHAALYALSILLPLSGYVKLAALGFEIRPFGLIVLPAMEVNVALAGLARAVHRGGALALGGLIGLHVAAALFHIRLFGAPVLYRMTGPCQADRKERADRCGC